MGSGEGSRGVIVFKVGAEVAEDCLLLVGILNRLGLSPKGEEAVLVEVLENLVLGIFLCDEVLEEFFVIVDQGG